LERHFDFYISRRDDRVLNVEIQAASVDTGSGLKDGKLKGPDFFDVDRNPLITFRSTNISQSGPDTFEWTAT